MVLLLLVGCMDSGGAGSRVPEPAESAVAEPESGSEPEEAPPQESATLLLNGIPVTAELSDYDFETVDISKEELVEVPQPEPETGPFALPFSVGDSLNNIYSTGSVNPTGEYQILASDYNGWDEENPDRHLCIRYADGTLKRIYDSPVQDWSARWTFDWLSDNTVLVSGGMVYDVEADFIHIIPYPDREFLEHKAEGDEPSEESLGERRYDMVLYFWFTRHALSEDKSYMLTSLQTGDYRLYIYRFAEASWEAIPMVFENNPDNEFDSASIYSELRDGDTVSFGVRRWRPFYTLENYTYSVSGRTLTKGADVTFSADEVNIATITSYNNPQGTLLLHKSREYHHPGISGNPTGTVVLYDYRSGRQLVEAAQASSNMEWSVLEGDANILCSRDSGRMQFYNLATKKRYSLDTEKAFPNIYHVFVDRQNGLIIARNDGQDTSYRIPGL